jgi:hypothetical protein
LLVLPALLAIFCAWFAVRWYVGDVVAEYAPAPEQGGVEMAQIAVRWAPDDPLTHWRLASFEEKTFSAENLAAAVQQYQLAVKASPYDYRYWMELGRALEATGDRDASEKALRRAVELAPNYSHPLWQYGNVLLRQGKTAEAFVQLSKAANADESMRKAVFGLAWQVFGGDINEILKVITQPTVRMQLAIELINQNRFDAASSVLRTLSPAERKAQGELTDEVVKAFIENRQFHAGLKLMQELETDSSQLPVPEQLWNGGFDQPVPNLDSRPFHWLINSRPQTQISIDSRAHSGTGALRLVFSITNKLEKIPISQKIIVDPNTSYTLQFYVRTNKLISASTPIVVITDDTGNEWLGQSPPAQTGTNDWELVTFTFRSKANSDGVGIGIFRSPCEGETICPIFGTVWYDDFNLQRVDGPSSGSGKTRAGIK